jgi:hypothetical protein
MSITPAYEVNIWNFNDETVTVKLMTLMTWCSALKSELKGYQVTSTPVFPIVRKYLSVPNSYPDDMLYQHIQDSYDSIKEQLGLGDK